MKGRIIKIVLLILSAAVLFFAVNTFFCSPQGVAPDIIDINEIKIKKLEPDSLQLNVELLALNKNNSDVELDNVFLYVMEDNDTIGHVFTTDDILIERFDTSLISFSANLETHKSIKIASEKKDTISLRMHGEVTADVGLISLPVEIDLVHKFNLRKKITETVENDIKDNNLISVESAKIQSLGLDKSEVVVEFNLTNPYEIELTLKNYPSQIYINDNYSGDGNIPSEILLANNSIVSTGSVLYKLNNLNTISSLIGSILKRKLEYRTLGILEIEVLGYNIRFPYTFEGVLIKV